MQTMPDDVEDIFGHNLWLVQSGRNPEIAVSPFEGSAAGDILKLSERFDGDTYRCVYAAKFEKAVYVLHVFQKKSKSGIATPQAEIDLVQSRLRTAREHYAQTYPQEKKS